MLYLSLGSQPVVSSILKDCNLNTNSTIFDNVGEYSYQSLLSNLKNKFINFFPHESDIRVYGGTINIVNGIPYNIIKDTRTNTLFYDVLPTGKILSTVYKGAKNRYERLASEFMHTIQNANSAIFIRQMLDDNDNDTPELSNTLKYVFPACKFYLKHRYAGLGSNKCYTYWKNELCRGM